MAQARIQQSAAPRANLHRAPNLRKEDDGGHFGGPAPLAGQLDITAGSFRGLSFCGLEEGRFLVLGERAWASSGVVSIAKAVIRCLLLDPSRPAGPSKLGWVRQ